VVKEHPDLVYLVAGDGPERESLRSIAHELGIMRHVKFMGALADPRPIYHAADAFIFLSKGEASPLALLEAMASGLPVIVAQEPPLDELAAPGGAIFVDRNNRAEVAQTILKLLADSHMRLTMGQINRHYVEAHFGWERIARCYLDLFEEELRCISSQV